MEAQGRDGTYGVTVLYCCGSTYNVNLSTSRPVIVYSLKTILVCCCCDMHMYKIVQYNYGTLHPPNVARYICDEKSISQSIACYNIEKSISRLLCLRQSTPNATKVCPVPIYSKVEFVIGYKLDPAFDFVIDWMIEYKNRSCIRCRVLQKSHTVFMRVCDRDM